MWKIFRELKKKKRINRQFQKEYKFFEIIDYLKNIDMCNFIINEFGNRLNAYTFCICKLKFCNDEQIKKKNQKIKRIIWIISYKIIWISTNCIGEN